MPQRITSHSPLFRLLLAAAGTTCALSAAQAHAAPTLEGWALMPAQTSAEGPTSGQFAITPGSAPYLPLVNAQPVPCRSPCRARRRRRSCLARWPIRTRFRGQRWTRC